jgi:hypothetical protein
MLIPTFNINISGNVLAAYGAILSTVTASAQILSYLRDKARLHIAVQHDMEIIGERYKGMLLTIIKVSNRGRRPVTITNVGAYRLHPHKAFIVPDASPRIPCELTEGKEVKAMFDQSDVDFSLIEAYEAYTAGGHTFRLNVAPWYKRWISRYRRKREWKREAKERAAKK